MIDSERRIVDVNAAWERVLGWRPEQLVGLRVDWFVHPDDRVPTAAATAGVHAEEARMISFENRLRCQDGAYLWVSWTAKPTHEGSTYAIGRVNNGGLQGLASPPKEFFRRVVESSDDAIVTKDRDAVITSWNEGAQRLYGYSREEAIGESAAILIPPERRGEELELLAAVLAGDSVDHYETERITKDGRRLDISLRISAVRAEDGRVVGAAAIARDITERKTAERNLLLLAQHDPLTGLLNRTRFEQELDERLRYASRYGHPGALLALDVDHFKVINDSSGHAAADGLLQRIARALYDRVRDVDVVARTGGDEFAVLLTEIQPEDALEVARKLKDDIACQWQGRTVTSSIGLATFDRTTTSTARDLMVAADVALYDAKDAGRNRVETYSGQRAASVGWVARIRQALDEDRLMLEAQPIVRVRSKEVVHEELLLRMIDEQGKVLPPAAFLPTAERFGMVQELDRWVVDRAIELAGGGRHVAVNLSGRSISDPELVSRIAKRLRDSGTDPRKLVFEITETAAVVNLAEAHRATQYLSEMGCAFALDDFGTGFGPFSYLKRLPVKYLKIDSDFVRNLRVGSADSHVVKAVVSLARAFDKVTIAEGVENEPTLQALAAYGVDCVQGFHVGRPQPIAA